MKLNHRHKLIALQLAMGKTHGQIAEAVGMHEKSVARLATKPEIKAAAEEALESMQERVVTRLVDRFDQAAPEAFEEVRRLMREAKSENARLRASESILDRSRVAPKRQIHTKHEHDNQFNIIQIGASKVQEIAEVMREIGHPPSFVPAGDVTAMVRKSDGKIFPYPYAEGAEQVQ